ncbi:MAG: type IV secretory system conjugative DNA transfer family protein [Clostridia bacterium]|nr:type IV secretory system conjugative DNA transfer family protein [Clostridia bacterium]
MAKKKEKNTDGKLSGKKLGVFAAVTVVVVIAAVVVGIFVGNYLGGNGFSFQSGATIYKVCVGGLILVAYGFLAYRLVFYKKSGSYKVIDKDKSMVEGNLENSRFLTEQERDANFRPTTYDKLSNENKDGVLVRAQLAKNGKLNINFCSPCHSIIIGSTGSGKTTTFVNPMIQCLAQSGCRSSMIVTDPKGELVSLHSKKLVERGYKVCVLDLRDTYSSFRWNPLSQIYDSYQEYLWAQDEVYLRTDNVEESGLPMLSSKDSFGEEWYEFDGKAFSNTAQLVSNIKIYKQRLFDEVYEDLNDLVSVLVPVANQSDPMWENGARTIVLAVLLAMLEDSEDPDLGMTKEKFNFYNMTKILQNSSNDYMDLRRYFAGRDVLSKAYALSKQVLDSADSTRASYMSVVFEKIAMFNDMGICGLTSASDIVPQEIATQPTALFLKIPDEKDTRHNLAAIFILNIYKALIKIASAREDLSLERNVYFILDEFGNMPKIEKFDKMITVGRSRKIWFEMIVQSYSQLDNVYGQTVGDIVKSNCGIKMFIGSNDIGTCKEFSELCGNCSVLSQSSSKSSAKYAETSYSTSVQVRPLIYPSELQRLNNKNDTGNSIIVTFGNFPLKTKFTPSYKVPFYETGIMDMDAVYANVFNEGEVFYDIAKRNEVVLNEG